MKVLNSGPVKIQRSISFLALIRHRDQAPSLSIHCLWENMAFAWEPCKFHSVQAFVGLPPQTVRDQIQCDLKKDSVEDLQLDAVVRGDLTTMWFATKQSVELRDPID
jgi:hypothetical protein